MYQKGKMVPSLSEKAASRPPGQRFSRTSCVRGKSEGMNAEKELREYLVIVCSRVRYSGNLRHNR